MEQFYSIQGEGANTGKAACFIRIGGCDVGCYWCDVKESWNPDIHPLTPTDHIVTQTLKFPAKAAVITGGEPLMYNMDYLCSELKSNGINLFLETSGAYTLSGEWDWICLSPKRRKHPLEDMYNKANELKVIVFEEDDFLWAEECAEKVNAGCQLFLQPEWSRRELVTPAIIDYVMNNPGWQISLQTHKYLRIP